MATRTDKGIRRFMKHAGEGGVATTYGAVHFKNPAGSNYLAVLRRVMVDNAKHVGTEKDWMGSLGRKDTDLSGGSYVAATVSLRAQEDAGGDSACTIGAFSAADDTTDAPTTVFGKVAVAADASFEIDFTLPDDPTAGLYLGPGTGVVVKCTRNDLTDIDVSFEWDERRIL